ncbi:Nucleoid occlusion protein [bioreactor metagenome]|uniref:Nucleoid occlusion protein n=1 Tax=bioreactor metagenome TaxID=1076179 RepID=A0A644X8U2_9ZZZZ
MKEQKPEFKNVKIADLVSSDMNPRKTFSEDSLKELSDSIFEKGVLQPIVVRPVGKKFEIVCGERRYRAAKMATLKEIPAMVRQLDDEEAFDLMITENLQREDVQPMEEAAAFAELLKRNNDYAAIAVRFGKSEVYVRLRVKLNDLIPEFQDLLQRDIISITIALEICKQQDYVQKEIFQDEFDNMEEPWWACPTLSELKEAIRDVGMPRISDAKFDVENKNLIKKAGSCITCVANTACQSSLFPEEEDKARCTNPRCFKAKAEQHLNTLLDEAVKDGAFVAVSKYGYGSNLSDKEKELEEKGFNVINLRSYNSIRKPEEPNKSEYNFEDLESAAEYEQNKAEYDEDIKVFENEISSPDVIKVIIVENDGEIAYFRKAGITRGSNNKESVETIAIMELNSKLQRGKELEIEGINKDLFKLVESHFTDMDDKTIIATSANNYAQSVESAIKMFFYMDCSATVQQILMKKHLPKKEHDLDDEKVACKIIDKLEPEDWNIVIKSFLLGKLLTNYPNSYTSTYKALTEIAKFTNPDAAADIIDRHEKKYAKKKASIEAQIAALKKDKKSKKEKEPELAAS